MLVPSQSRTVSATNATYREPHLLRVAHTIHPVRYKSSMYLMMSPWLFLARVPQPPEEGLLCIEHLHPRHSCRQPCPNIQAHDAAMCAPMKSVYHHVVAKQKGQHGTHPYQAEAGQRTRQHHSSMTWHDAIHMAKIQVV